MQHYDPSHVLWESLIIKNKIIGIETAMYTTLRLNTEAILWLRKGISKSIAQVNFTVYTKFICWNVEVNAGYSCKEAVLLADSVNMSKWKLILTVADVSICKQEA